MADQTEHATSKEDVKAQTATILMAQGFKMFDVLHNLDLDARAAAIDCLYENSKMPPEVALDLLTDPLNVRKQIESDPWLSMLLLISAAAAQASLAPDALDTLRADLVTLRKTEEEKG